MPRSSRPWFRSDRNSWFVWIKGKLHKLGADQRKAKQRFHELMANPESRPSQIISTNLSVLLANFLDWCQRTKAEGTYLWYKRRILSFLQSAEGLTVEALKPFHVDEWIRKHPKWAPGQQRGAIIAIQRPLNWAVEMGYLERSPVARLKKPPQGRRDNVITPQVFARMVELIRDQPFRDLVIVAWEVGCRPHEILSVEDRHLDHDRWVFPLEESKGKKRIRVVYLTDQAAAICKRLGCQWPTGPIFRNTEGRPWTPFSINCRFCRLQKKLGMKFALVDFRHSWTTKLLKAGIDPITISALAGHVDGSMVSKVYAHVHADAEHLRKALGRSTKPGA